MGHKHHLLTFASAKVQRNAHIYKFLKKKIKKMQKNLVMSKKSSTFARFFA
jgi:hypothetical protein